MTTPAYLRLRQVCLVSRQLEPSVAALKAIFGLATCFRDPGVAVFGLENALFAFGESFLEIVSPTTDGTAAGRFLDRSGGVGGYMLIFDCDDPKGRRQRAESLGFRVAYTIDHPGCYGIQLHPRDCRAAILEFDHTDGGEALDGRYYPAGENWQVWRRPEQVQGLALADVETPDPADLAKHWSTLMAVQTQPGADGSQTLGLDFGSVRLVGAAPGTPERISALRVQVGNPAAVLAAALQQSCQVQGGRFMLAGVWFEPVPGTSRH